MVTEPRIHQAPLNFREERRVVQHLVKANTEEWNGQVRYMIIVQRRTVEYFCTLETNSKLSTWGLKPWQTLSAPRHIFSWRSASVTVFFSTQTGWGYDWDAEVNHSSLSHWVTIWSVWNLHNVLSTAPELEGGGRVSSSIQIIFSGAVAALNLAYGDMVGAWQL